jgi:hypothetical protein
VNFTLTVCAGYVGLRSRGSVFFTAKLLPYGGQHYNLCPVSFLTQYKLANVLRREPLPPGSMVCVLSDFCELMYSFGENGEEAKNE